MLIPAHMFEDPIHSDQTWSQEYQSVLRYQPQTCSILRCDDVLAPAVLFILSFWGLSYCRRKRRYILIQTRKLYIRTIRFNLWWIQVPTVSLILWVPNSALVTFPSLSTVVNRSCWLLWWTLPWGSLSFRKRRAAVLPLWSHNYSKAHIHLIQPKLALTVLSNALLYNYCHQFHTTVTMCSVCPLESVTFLLFHMYNRRSISTINRESIKYSLWNEWLVVILFWRKSCFFIHFDLS